MATRSLSPKQVLERLRRHRAAVMTLALMSAKKVVQAQIRARGQRLSDFSAREISHLAEVELECNRPRLIAEAEGVIATSPLFVRWRCAQLTTNAQKENEPKSTASAVQNSCSEWRAGQ